MKKNVLPDYGQDTQWLVKPEKIRFPVDVFYLCPTEYQKSGDVPPVCRMDDAEVRASMLEQIENKGSAFITAGNFFAPMYAQANVKCLVNNDPEATIALMEGPVATTQAAFEYYMAHFNNGRPFILAGHSQGSIMLSLLLASVFKKHPEYNKQLVAAYIIGYSITPFYLAENPHLRFAKGPTDTGVIISYNTEAPGMTERNITLLDDSLCINPITWTRGTETAPAHLSQGSHLIIRDRTGKITARKDVPQYADATINLERGVVVCSTANPDDFLARSDRAFFPRGILHTGDYPLYYYDLRKNAQDRIQAYLKTH